MTEDQEGVCRRLNVACESPTSHSKIGVEKDMNTKKYPLNGLRHYPVGETNGWYIWSGGEVSPRSDFFEPVHTFHICEELPEIYKYLGLPPGWRFLVAGDHEDLWFDAQLLRG